MVGSAVVREGGIRAGAPSPRALTPATAEAGDTEHAQATTAHGRLLLAAIREEGARTLGPPSTREVGGRPAPVIDDHTGSVVAVDNTGDEDGEQCTLGNPCGADRKGRITVCQDTHDAQETYGIVPCVVDGSTAVSAAYGVPSCGGFTPATP